MKKIKCFSCLSR